MKKILSILTSAIMLVGIAVPAYAEDTVAPQTETKEIVSYNIETGEKNIKTVTYELIAEDVDTPPEEGKARSEAQSDQSALDHLESIGLLDEHGNLDEKAFAALPTEDQTETGASPYTVIGADNRTKVSSVTVAPYKFVARLVMTWPNGVTSTGTGTVYGTDAIVTCAHNVYGQNTDNSHSYHEEPTRLTAILSNGQYYSANYYDYSTAWENTGDYAEDYAVVIFSENIGSIVGKCGIASTTRDLVGQTVEVPGYPATVQGNTGNISMWTHSEKATRQATNGRLYYKVDTSGGNSGSPVFWNGSYIAAIHAYGAASENSGRRIDASVKSFFDFYR